MREPTREELEYVRVMVTLKRPLCWWCENRPRKPAETECLVSLDWRETAAMERRKCEKFSLDFKRIGNAKEPEPWYRVHKKPEQLNIDFTGDKA